MRIPLISDARKMRDTARRRVPERRDDSGLTTLEWLLIVAAVAGLAALAVVLVQNVVGDTSEQIAGSSARKTAAQIAAIEIMADAERDHGVQPASAKSWGDWVTHYAAKCNRLKITYGDAGVTVAAQFNSSGAATNSVLAADVKTNDVTITIAGTAPPGAAHCSVR